MMTLGKLERVIEQLQIIGEDPAEILQNCDDVQLINDSLAHVLQLLQKGDMDALDELATICLYTQLKLKKGE